MWHCPLGFSPKFFFCLVLGLICADKAGGFGFQILLSSCFGVLGLGYGRLGYGRLGYRRLGYRRSGYRLGPVNKSSNASLSVKKRN